jgi:hypothetical protein
MLLKKGKTDQVYGYYLSRTLSFLIGQKDSGKHPGNAEAYKVITM